VNTWSPDYEANALDHAPVYTMTMLVNLKVISRVAIDPDSKIRTTEKRERHIYATRKSAVK